jgi:hypothetical protein
MAAGFAVVAGPFAAAVLHRIRHHKRQRLVNSRRRINVLEAEARAQAATPQPSGKCAHTRSKRRAQAGPDGTYRSVCKWCGTPMTRLAKGRWIPDEPEDAVIAIPPAAAEQVA